MMRKNQEINKAIAILQKKDDKFGQIQIEILKNRRSEIWVFEHFIRNASNETRDEATYCAARDAAKFLYGKLELEELIPDAEKYPVEASTVTVEPLTQNEMWKKIQELTLRVERLERMKGHIQDFNEYTPNLQENEQELEDNEGYMLQSVAYKYIGCSLTTLKSWKKKGVIPFYRKGGRIYFKKSDIDNNPVLNQYRNKYK